MKFIVSFLMLCAPCVATAQTIESRIYVCTDASGGVRLNNMKSTQGCITRTIKTPVAPPRQLMGSALRLGDPMPSPNALIVGARVSSAVQAHRDQSRTQILQSELNQAQTSLIELQSEYQNTLPEHLGDAPNNSDNMRRSQDLKRKIQLTQANIGALQREIGRE